MIDETNKIIKMTTFEILNSLCDIYAVLETGVIDTISQVVELDRFVDNQLIDKANFANKLSYLKQRNFINKIIQDQKTCIQITEKGMIKLRDLALKTLSIKTPEKWDKKWRIVIFDVPETAKTLRDVIRTKLYHLGFRQIQKSVFVFPFECAKEINLICSHYGGKQYLKYMIADIIEGEEEIMSQFIKAGTLDLRKHF